MIIENHLITTDVYLGIGSNEGDPILNCQKALDRLSRGKKIWLEKKSSLYKTEPINYTNQPWFINRVVKVRSCLKPKELRSFLREIEISLGRKDGIRWGPRPIDLDVLFYGNLVISEEDLVLPHPRLQERKFVLVPLEEIASEFVHPVLKKSIKELLEGLREEQRVERLNIK
jgi:dihydroneopterin aldolase / 2-amino-4-hydroxy-6-hydroxymethyldihydropteridine diphosphokinase